MFKKFNDFCERILFKVDDYMPAIAVIIIGGFILSLLIIFFVKVVFKHL